MFKYEVVVVLYNSGIDDSETLLSLYNAKGFLSQENHIIVWDNSPVPVVMDEDFLLKEKYHPCKVSYYWNGENSSLSYIYNTVRKEINSKYTIILDDDTSLPEDIFVCIDEVTTNKDNIDVNLFLPILCSCEKIVSPAYEYRFSHRPIPGKIVGQIECCHLQAMNSGMVINSNYYREVFSGYNEKLKFYGTDNDFMRKYRKQNKYAFILPISINHRSNFREDPLPQRVQRFAAIKDAGLILAREEGYLMYLFERFRYFYISLKYGLREHTVLFTMVLFKKRL